MKNLTFVAALSALISLGPLLGCANIVEGSEERRIQLGHIEQSAGPPDYQLHITESGTPNGAESGTPDAEGFDPILGGSAAQIRATNTTSITTHTLRTEEQVRSILPYSPLRETAEFLSSPFYLLWAIPTWSWNQWFAMLNPALNSETMWKGTRVEEITHTQPIEPLVEVERRTDRIGVPVEIALDGLPPRRVTLAAEGPDTEVDLVDLLTARAFDPPTSLRSRILMEGPGESATASLRIQPGLGERLFRAQPYLIEPSSGRHSPTEIAVAVLGLSELGFAKRSSSLRSSSSLIFGRETMDREIAAQYIAIARNQKIDGQWAVALKNIAAARGLDRRVQTDWDELEADVLEKSALESLGAGQYEVARAGLLKATTVDPNRQSRLAPFVTMAIEASDRARESQATQQSREAFLAIERERADAETLVRSNAARPAPATSAVGTGPRASGSD